MSECDRMRTPIEDELQVRWLRLRELAVEAEARVEADAGVLAAKAVWAKAQRRLINARKKAKAKFRAIQKRDAAELARQKYIAKSWELDCEYEKKQEPHIDYRSFTERDVYKQPPVLTDARGAMVPQNGVKA